MEIDFVKQFLHCLFIIINLNQNKIIRINYINEINLKKI